MKIRTFVLNDTITARRIKGLIKSIELCKSKNINLYLCSDGGETWMADVFIDFTHRINKKINLIGVGKMSSACVHVFMEAKGKKLLQPHTIAMIHFSTFSPESRLLLDRKSHDSILSTSTKNANEERLQKYIKMIGLSDKEISFLRKGGDLMIDYERLKKALPTINNFK